MYKKRFKTAAKNNEHPPKIKIAPRKILTNCKKPISDHISFFLRNLA